MNSFKVKVWTACIIRHNAKSHSSPKPKSDLIFHSFCMYFTYNTDIHSQELQQLSAKYQSLPPGQRGPDEITVAGPELAAAAAKAAEAAAAAVVSEAEAEATAADASSPEGSRRGGVDGTLGGGGGEGRDAVAAAAESVKVAANKAAAAAAGRVLIEEAPAVASVLHVQLGVPKEKVKRLLLKWPRLLEVS